MEVGNSISYKVVRVLADLMDKYAFDPIIGLLLPGTGDLLSAVTALPCLYVSITKIKSWSLTLAIINNMLIDIFLGIIPWIGEILDIFYQSNLRSYGLVRGFVEGDERVVQTVNRKARWTIVSIAIVLVLIVLMFCFVVSAATSLFHVFDGAFK